MKKVFLGFLLILLVVLGVIFLNYFTLASKQLPVEGTKTDISSIKGAEERIAQSLTYPTVSYEDTSLIDFEQYYLFHTFLRGTFPNIFHNVNVEMVNDLTMMLHWEGTDKSLKPGILMAHYDVVPVSDDTKDMWSVPPFQGVIKGDTLFGRGSVDNKINLMAQLEAIDFLLKNKYWPKRDLYFVFGHDEEIGGVNGALAVAKLLKSRGIEADFVLDEGGFVTEHMVPGVSQPVALVGTSEKGYLNLELSVNINGGHSSMPAPNNSIATLSKALYDLSQQPFAPTMSQSMKDFIEHIAPHSSFINRLAMSNTWLFQPVINSIYSASPAGNAMIRTSMVPTIIHGGVKANVIPNVVTANVNYRILPGMSIEQVVERTKKAINNPEVHVKVLQPTQEASPVSPINTTAFKQISDAIHLNFDNTIVTPFLMIAGTDSKHFDIVTDKIYKFSPMLDPVGFHGVDEYLILSDYKKAIGFYIDFIKVQ